jgi:hypothetical protein
MRHRNCFIPSFIFLIIIIISIAIIFIYGKNSSKVWADYTALSAIISGLSFLGIIYTIYVMNKISHEDLKARHILLQIEMSLRWAELHKDDQLFQSDININIGCLEKELSKISGFDFEHVYKQRNKDDSK